ncbi:hypothetical protein [Methylobacterium gnaphalii]|uniref:Anti-sigma factor n=1 Tax=Methylobacterium gnaphalii TaxID=1010610 RepID=A0A512JNN7_9HYPH|nr:hypothetical protein [Methylobacterium gnaphalii]GEP11577.1 hypothetical protein MGN01_34220 [Methylobacterium gnaphalii]GJD70318.1 hypothetical protein MMMDOFMJ_3263 [Methylobacterium gnaphalii]GLS47212.1 hypothetical protein GCM10007885_00560 [Methylobacterium gnaphalii]
MTAGEPGQDRKPDEIDLLLPWHAVERLSAEEAERVEAALRADPERARHLEIAREERAETVALNQGLGMPSRAARDKVFARIEAEGRKPHKGFSERWRHWLAGLAPRSLAWSGAVAALVIAVQAGLLTMAYFGKGSGGYQTASAPVPAAVEGTFVLVAFTPAATTERIETLLRDTRATIVEGPLPGGVFRLRLEERGEAASRTIEQLRSKTALIRLVAPVTPSADRPQQPR